MTGTAPNHERHRRRLGSTYRLQLSGLGFARAARLVPYLDALGVETLYVSPVTMAVPGSTHGYDVVDPTRLDPALGSADELDALLAALAGRDMRLLIDVVPNHMAAAAANPWWWDVLARGRGSPFAPYFDIDWTKHEGRVLLPVLGRSLAAVIADGELSVAFEAGVAVLSYYHHRFPIGPGTPVRLVRSLLSVRPEPSPEGILAEGTSADESSEDDSSADDGSADDCYADDCYADDCYADDCYADDMSRAARPPALPTGLLAPRPPRGELSAILRRGRTGRCPGRGPGGVRGNPRAAPPAGRRRPCRRAEGRPRRRSGRPDPLPCPARPRPRSG